MIIYIKDTTTNPPTEKRVTMYSEAVKCLEEISNRKFRQTRKERMQILEELGHGYDDHGSVNFVRQMASVVEIGVIRGDRRIPCDITTLNEFQKEEFGN